jgi:hypothetical protein
MNNATWTVLSGIAAAALAAACGSSSGGGSSTTTSATATGGSGTTSATATGGSGTTSATATGGSGTTSTTTSTTSTAACSGATPAALTVKNVDLWCTVSVNGGAGSAAAEQTVCVADGMVSLSATANTGFVLGDWHGTTGDSGNGDPGTVSNGTSTAKVNVTGSSACVWICCPGSSGTLACPTTNACP